jgi:hypothetical protein
MALTFLPKSKDETERERDKETNHVKFYETLRDEDTMATASGSEAKKQRICIIGHFLNK